MNGKGESDEWAVLNRRTYRLFPCAADKQNEPTVGGMYVPLNLLSSGRGEVSTEQVS